VIRSIGGLMNDVRDSSMSYSLAFLKLWYHKGGCFNGSFRTGNNLPS